MKPIKVGSRTFHSRQVMRDEAHVDNYNRILKHPHVLVTDLATKPTLIKCLKRALIFRSMHTTAVHNLVFHPAIKSSLVFKLTSEQYNRIHELFMKSETRGDFEKYFADYARGQRFERL